MGEGVESSRNIGLRVTLGVAVGVGLAVDVEVAVGLVKIVLTSVLVVGTAEDSIKTGVGEGVIFCLRVPK